MKINCHIYVINLDKREDRMRKMSTRLSNLNFTRVSAIDANKLDESVKDVKSPLSNAEKACILSHIKALKAFLSTSYSMCILLEDDVILGKGFLEFLRNFDSFPKNSYVIKLETFCNKLLCSKFKFKFNQLIYNRLYSIHFGSAAYATSRQGARHIIEEMERFQLPADHVIFERMLKNRKYGKAYQLNPACCIQEFHDEQSKDSDIYKERSRRLDNEKLVAKKAIRGSKIKKVYREIKRLLNQFLTFFIICVELIFNFLANRAYIKIKFR